MKTSVFVNERLVARGHKLKALTRIHRRDSRDFCGVTLKEQDFHLQWGNFIFRVLGGGQGNPLLFNNHKAVIQQFLSELADGLRNVYSCTVNVIISECSSKMSLNVVNIKLYGEFCC